MASRRQAIIDTVIIVLSMMFLIFVPVMISMCAGG